MAVGFFQNLRAVLLIVIYGRCCSSFKFIATGDYNARIVVFRISSQRTVIGSTKGVELNYGMTDSLNPLFLRHVITHFLTPTVVQMQPNLSVKIHNYLCDWICVGWVNVWGHYIRSSLPCPWHMTILGSIWSHYPTRINAYLHHLYRWLSTRLQYPQCVSNGDTAVLH